MNQFGYERLTAGTIVLSIIVLSVLIYQFFAFRADRPVDTRVAVATTVQLFPQSLPIQSGIPYLLSVTDTDQNTVELGVFYHKVVNLIEDDAGRVIEEGIFTLPPKIGSIQSVQLSLYDSVDTLQPRWIPFLRGTIQGDRTILTFQPVNLDTASGQFMLATPTDNNTLINERSGVWFGDILRNTSKLNLPSLPSGWVYEGWAVINGQTLTTGRFTNTSRADMFSGFSDSQSRSPSFPGEDFLINPPTRVFLNLTFPVDLASQSVMITIEPDHNGVDPTGQGSFPTEFLTGDIPRFAESGRLYELDLDLDNLPKATVVLR